MGIEKTISVQKVFSKSCYPWSMLPEKPRLTSGFHKKVFMKRPSVNGSASVIFKVKFFVTNNRYKTFDIWRFGLADENYAYQSS